MRYTPLPAEVYRSHRKKLTALLPKGAMVVLASNDTMPKNADGTMGFWQHADLFWLSGIDQENTFLVLFPDAPEEQYRELLFVQETSPEIRIWEGDKLTKAQATHHSGIENVRWNDQFWKILQQLMGEAAEVFLYTNEHPRQGNSVQTANQRLIAEIQAKWPLHRYNRLYPLTRKLRMVKDKEEQAQIGKACQITEAAFRRSLAFIAPGKWEYEVEAELLHEFIRSGSRGFAYTPIIAGGANACVLHYVENSAQLRDGDLLLLDVGCEYGNYASDLTRTVPVNGKFNKRQLDVYNAVLRVQKEAISLLRPGTNWLDFHKEVGKLMESELIGLKLLDKKEVKNQDPKQPLYKQYFMHGTSHHMGLDVHDVMDMYADFKPGMVFTCEPGIYIREEGIGIRIENDVVVQKNGAPKDLMASIPREAEEIEDLMNG